MPFLWPFRPKVMVPLGAQEVPPPGSEANCDLACHYWEGYIGVDRIHICTYIHMYMSYTCVLYVYVYTHDTYSCIHICRYVYICMYICICIYVFAHTEEGRYIRTACALHLGSSSHFRSSQVPGRYSKPQSCFYKLGSFGGLVHTIQVGLGLVYDVGVGVGFWIGTY